ncbi:DUF4430 domain-containing protein [Microbacteriaceae bacterium 4G12]
MAQMKKWLAASLMIVAMLVLSLTNGVHAVFAETQKATLVVVGDSEKKVIVCPKEVTLEQGETAYTLLKKELGDKVTTSGSGDWVYVSGIAGLKEKDRGEKSGWLYEVNGKSPDVGANSYKVKPGDVVAYRYSLDWGEDLTKQSLADSIKALGGCSAVVNPTEPPKEEKPTIKPESTKDVDHAIKLSAEYILTKGFESDWEAIGVIRSGYPVSNDVKKEFLQSLENRVKTSARLKNTDLERTILAVLAVGGDPTNIAGKNLIQELYNDQTIGAINSYIFGLIALDSKKYGVPADAMWTRDHFIQEILNLQHSDGGWALSNNKSGPSDPDVTGMAITALAPYKDRAEVSGALTKATKVLSVLQTDNGGYASFGKENSNSAAQVVHALSTLGIDPQGASFTKNGTNVLQHLLSYQLPNGDFKWLLKDGKGSFMSRGQALYALVQYKYFLDGKGSIFNWVTNEAPTDNGNGTGDNETKPDNGNGTSDNGTKPDNGNGTSDNGTKSDADNGTQPNSSTDTDQKVADNSKQEVKKQQLPETKLFDTSTLISTLLGFVLIVLGFVIWKRKSIL